MRGMTRLDRYLMREMVVPFLIGQGAVVLMLTGTVLYNNADTFLNYQIPAAGVARIALCFMPYLVGLTMPVATAIALSLAVSRMARDSEITAMRAAGISLWRIFRPAVAVGLAISAADFGFAEVVVPWANLQYERTMRELSQGVRFLAPQERQVVQSPDRVYTLYVSRMSLHGPLTQAHDVTLMIAKPGAKLPVVVQAPLADYVDGRWKLHDARVHSYSNGGTDEVFTHAKTVDIPFRLADRVFNLIYLQLPLYSPAAATSFREMLPRALADARAGFSSPQNWLDLHLKLSVPLSCVVFALCCPPLALRLSKAGNFVGVLLSISLVFVYWNTLLAAKIIGSRYPDILPPPVAGWGQNVLFSALGLWTLRRTE
ncbi:MAG: LptF/LptG family permease [Armatimonadetes bacterium]|nr:LptF/LptG family permease [Armatimonadota bacterium]